MQAANAHRREREFGLLVGGILAALGAWWIYRSKLGPVGPVCLGIGLFLVVLGVSAPSILRRPRKAWMALAEGLSFVMTRLILLLVFYLVVTPIGWLRRASGNDPLRRRTKVEGSFWVEYPARQRDPRHFEKMF